MSGEQPDTPELGQETPQVETPPVEVVPDGSVPKEETPATPDSPEAKVDATAEQKPETPAAGEKTPEQINVDRAHFQAEAQKAKEELKVLQAVEADEKPPVPSEKPETGIFSRDEFATMTDEDLRERLKDDPILAMQVQREQSRADIREAIHEARTTERQTLELQQATRIFNQFRANNNVPDEIVEQVKGTVKSSGLRGSPAAITELMIDRINYEMMRDHGRVATTKAEAAATEKVKTQLLTTQPGAAGGALKEPDPGQALADLIAPKTTQ